MLFLLLFFNYFGLSVTKHLSATTRMVLDSIRTLVVWGVDLGLGWEDFQYLQVIGFIFLLVGTAIYNKILYIPLGTLDYRYWAALEKEEIDTTQLKNPAATDYQTNGHSNGFTHQNQAINLLHAPLLNGNNNGSENNYYKEIGHNNNGFQ